MKFDVHTKAFSIQQNPVPKTFMAECRLPIAEC
jgi:hypothetical protein